MKSYRRKFEDFQMDPALMSHNVNRVPSDPLEESKLQISQNDTLNETRIIK